MAAEIDPEVAYYRAVEDYFATLRGVPHVLSPKDFHLMREWWRDEVPLAAVRAGITEVFGRRRERGEAAPVVSISYCRHAVRAHARRAAEMAVGLAAGGGADPPPPPAAALATLAAKLAGAAVRLRVEMPRTAEVISGFATAVEGAAELPVAAVEEHLFALESALLANCLDAIDESQRHGIEERARTDAATTAATPDARERTFRALRDRLLRELLSLPRLELGG
jgi:hypothetical protein